MVDFLSWLRDERGVLLCILTRGEAAVLHYLFDANFECFRPWRRLFADPSGEGRCFVANSHDEFFVLSGDRVGKIQRGLFGIGRRVGVVRRLFPDT